MTRVPKSDCLSLIHLKHQSAFFFIVFDVLTALNNLFFSLISLTYVSINKEYVSEWIFSIAI